MRGDFLFLEDMIGIYFLESERRLEKIKKLMATSTIAPPAAMSYT
jgi:hypothetical protein